MNPRSSIFVYSDKARPDVCKAVITGPADTPYACGWFEFDIFFPPDFPHRPPQFYFVTGARSMLRFSPNLYTGMLTHAWCARLCVHVADYNTAMVLPATDGSTLTLFVAPKGNTGLL